MSGSQRVEAGRKVALRNETKKTPGRLPGDFIYLTYT